MLCSEQYRVPILYKWAGHSSPIKNASSVGGSGPTSNTRFLEPKSLPPQTVCQPVQPFLQGSPKCPTHTDTYTTLRTTSVAIGRIFAQRVALQPLATVNVATCCYYLHQVMPPSQSRLWSQAVGCWPEIPGRQSHCCPCGLAAPELLQTAALPAGHTHIHNRLTALCPGLPGWAGTIKVKPIWILLKQETASGSGIIWATCKSAPRSRQITTPAPHHSVFYRPDALPGAQPTASKHWRHYLHVNETQMQVIDTSPSTSLKTWF